MNILNLALKLIDSWSIDLKILNYLFLKHRKILLAEVVGQGEFAISIDYVNENYTALGKDPRVYVPEPIYVRAELDVDDPDNYVLQVFCDLYLAFVFMNLFSMISA